MLLISPSQEEELLNLQRPDKLLERFNLIRIATNTTRGVYM